MVASAQTVPVDPALAEIAATHRFLQTAISPDGSRVAYVEAGTGPNQSAIYIAPRIRVTAGDGKMVVDESQIAWSADSKQIAFLSDHEKKDQLQLYVAPASGGLARQLTHLKGLLAEPKWSPDGKQVAILFTENLPHAAGPLDPVPPDSGVLGAKIFEQRLTIVDVATAAAKQVSPKDMYIYEYDWSPDGRTFAATCFAGRGRRQLVDRATLHHAVPGRRHEEHLQAAGGPAACRAALVARWQVGGIHRRADER